MLRLLWVSNSPWASTGYGVETKGIIRWLRDQGHQVAVLCFWGLEGGRIEWEGIPCLPRHLDAYGNDAIPFYAREWHADVIFTLIDAWVLDPNIRNLGYWVCMVPIDHDVVPVPVLERLNLAHLCVPYARYGERKMLEAGVPATKITYAPHAVDCEVYRPLATPKADLRRKYYNGDEDCFWIGSVAANKGWPARKGFPELLEAFAAFYHAHPDARLYMHTAFDDRFRGPDLNRLRQAPYGIPDGIIYFAYPSRIMDGYPDELMCELYNSLDLFANPAYGEGFGIPAVEAQACGVPVVLGDNTAQTELCGAGWLVKTRAWEPTLVGANWARPDPADLLQAFEEAYAMWRDRPSEWAALKQKARAFARGYDWPLVLERYWVPLMERVEADVLGVAADARSNVRP